MDKDYVGVEIDGTEMTLSKDARITVGDDGLATFSISDAYETFSGSFTVAQFDALLDMLLTAREVLA